MKAPGQAATVAPARPVSHDAPHTLPALESERSPNAHALPVAQLSSITITPSSSSSPPSAPTAAPTAAAKATASAAAALSMTILPRPSPMKVKMKTPTGGTPASAITTPTSGLGAPSASTQPSGATDLYWRKWSAATGTTTGTASSTTLAEAASIMTTPPRPSPMKMKMKPPTSGTPASATTTPTSGLGASSASAQPSGTADLYWRKWTAATPTATTVAPSSMTTPPRPSPMKLQMKTPNGTPTGGTPSSAVATPTSGLGPSSISTQPCGATDLYWTKLHALLTDAHAVITHHLRPPSGVGPVEHVGDRGRLAVLLQGLSPSESDATLDASSRTAANDGDGTANVDVSVMRQLLSAQSAGRFEQYGVPDAHVDWVCDRLKKMAGAEMSPDWVRVSVFEAEVACLPVAVVDTLLAARKSMRKLRSRVDTCVRILVGMEGRGRRVAAATLDRLKATLEKAEVAAQTEAAKAAIKIAAAEAVKAAKAAAKVQKAEAKAEKEREREREREKEREAEAEIESKAEGGDTPSSARKAALDGKRRKAKAQQSAQASFMMRFVKGKAGPGGDGGGSGSGGSGHGDGGNTNGDGGVGKDGENSSGGDLTAAENEKIARRREGKTAALVATDRNMMSASWWVSSQMSAMGYAALDAMLEGDGGDGDGDAMMAMPNLGAHLVTCKRRRVAAQKGMHAAMRDFRRTRREYVGDRNPRFVTKRSDARGRCDGHVVKMLQFDENHRPAYYGTWRPRSTTVTGRKPLGREAGRDYEHDSEDDWDEDDDAEDLSDIEMEKDRANEDAELRELYGSDESDDDDFSGGEDGEDGDDDDDGNDSGAAEEGTAPSDKISVSQDSVQYIETTKVSGDASTGMAPATANGDAMQGVAGNGVEEKPAGGGDPSADVRKPGAVPTAKSKEDAKDSGKRAMKDGAMARRRVKRRKGGVRKNVVITGPSLPVADVAAGVTTDAAAAATLSRFAVTVRNGCGPITMFNPYVLNAADVVGEHLKGKASRRY